MTDEDTMTFYEVRDPSAGPDPIGIEILTDDGRYYSIHTHSQALPGIRCGTMTGGIDSPLERREIDFPPDPSEGDGWMREPPS